MMRTRSLLVLVLAGLVAAPAAAGAQDRQQEVAKEGAILLKTDRDERRTPGVDTSTVPH